MFLSKALLFSALVVSLGHSVVIPLISPTQNPQKVRQQQSIEFASGQTYVYEYSSRVLSGVPQLANQFAGIELQSDVVIQGVSSAVANMKLTDIRVGRHNGPLQNDFPTAGVAMEHQMDAQFQRHLSKPIRFQYAGGRVRAFEADQSEPEWSLNMKKALLSLLQLNLTPKKIIRSPLQSNHIQRNPQTEALTLYPVYEDGIGGVCETVYQLNHVPDQKQRIAEQESLFVLNVTKTRNYDNCLTEPTIANDNYDQRGCPQVCRQRKSFSAVAGYYPTPDAVSDPYMSGCVCGTEPHESPVDSYNYVKYNISLESSLPTIESVYSEGKTVYSTNGDQLLVFTQQNLTLAGKGSAANAIAFTIPNPQRHSELSFRIPKPEVPVGFKLPLDIPYYHLFGQPNAEELQTLIPQLLDSLSADVISGADTQKNAMQKSVQLVNALAVLPPLSLQQLYEEVAKAGYSIRATQKERVMRKLFLDAIPLSGSNSAAIFVKQLIDANNVTTNEAKEMVEAVPQNLFLIDSDTLDAYLQLFQSPKVQSRRHLFASAGIAFGKMVFEACVKRQNTPGDTPDGQNTPQQIRSPFAQIVAQQAAPTGSVAQQIRSSLSGRMKRSVEWESQFTQELCSPQDIERYVQIIASLLKQSNAFHQKVTLIETLAHMAVPQTLPVLEPYISGDISESECPGYPVENPEQSDEECDFVRQVAIYSLSHIAKQYPKQVSALALPVYSDASEPYELRIAAFTTLVFAEPEKQVLAQIASDLHRENNRQIRSFVYSALKTLANSTHPCYQKLGRNALNAFSQSPEAEYGVQYSKMIGSSFYDPQKQFGVYATAEWVANNISRIPRSAYVAVGQSSGPFQNDFIQIGFSQKGMESIVERVLEPNGLISDMFEGLHAKGKDRRVVTKRNADSAQQALEALKEKLQLEVRSDDEPKATLFFKLFDRTAYYPLDKHYVHQLIDGLEDSLKDAAEALMQGNDFQYVKLVMPQTLYKVVPSEVGLPVVVTHRHPAILSLKVSEAKLQIESAPKTVYPIGANITAQIQPSLFYSSLAFAFAVNPANRQAFGTHVEKSTQFSLPVEISGGYSRPNNLITWSVIPKVPQEVVYQRTQAKTFIARTQIAGSPDSDWLQSAEEVRSQAVPFAYDKSYGTQELGIGVRVQMNSENPWSGDSIFADQTYEKHGLAAALIQSWRNPGIEGREIHVVLETDAEEPIDGYDFTARYKWVADDEQSADSDDSDESSASDESDSDQSDDSSASQSSESKSSESNSESNDSSKSSKSSEESNESLKEKIRKRMQKAIQRARRSAPKEESNESSDEHSNESGSKSFSKSGSKESSQSSSSESNSSAQKARNPQTNSKSASAQSSESESSSSESDDSASFEDSVFDYNDVMKLILGQQFRKQTIKKITNQLIRKTQAIWSANWDEDADQSSSDESLQKEETEIPQTIAHDIAVTAVARGPRPSYYAANVLYAHTYDHRIVWLQTDGHAKTPKGVYASTPTLFCADAVVSYPTIANEFYYESQQMSGQKARVRASVGWGPQCHSDGGLIIAGVMENVDDRVITLDQLAVQNGRSGQQLENWYYRQCAIDRSEGEAQSYACERAIVEDSLFNQMIFDIKYKNVSKAVQNFTQKANLALKYALYHNLEVNAVGVDNPEEQIRVVAQYSSRVPDIQLANLQINTSSEVQHFSRIYVPFARPLSSLVSTQEIYANLLTGYEGQWDSCAAMENHIRTYDNVTFKTPSNPCQYLLSKDCSPKERFSVFAQTLDVESATKTVTLLTAGQEIKFVPPQQQNVAQVVVNGRAHELSFRKSLTLQSNSDQNIRIYLRATPSEATNPIVVLESDVNDLQIKYDGKNAKISLSPQYRGKTCGLCGDNNQESEDEFAGPDLCLYDSADDFANSYALSGLHCETTPQTQYGAKRCPPNQNQNQINANANQVIATKTVKQVIQANGDVTAAVVRQEVSASAANQRREAEQQSAVEELYRTQQKAVEKEMARNDGQPLSPPQRQQLFGANPQQQQILQRMRTQYVSRDDMVCFTVKPVLQCVEGVSRAAQTQNTALAFHCVSKGPLAQQWIAESEKRVIKELANKAVDLRQTFVVPLQCLPL